VAELRAAGEKTDPNAGTRAAGYEGMGLGNIHQDGLKEDLLGDSNLSIPVVSDHIHYSVPESAVLEVQSWCAKLFSAKAFTDTVTNPSNPSNPTLSANIPGVQLKFGQSSSSGLPTEAGRRTTSTSR
jgi:hypothetical protein